MENLVTLEIVQYLDGLQVTNVKLTASPKKAVTNRTACNIAANRLSKLINIIRLSKRNGARIGYKMNAVTYCRVWNDGELVIDTRSASDTFEEFGLPASFTFRGVTSCEKKRANVVGAFDVMAELTAE